MSGSLLDSSSLRNQRVAKQKLYYLVGVHLTDPLMKPSTFASGNFRLVFALLHVSHFSPITNVLGRKQLLLMSDLYLCNGSRASAPLWGRGRRGPFVSAAQTWVQK